MLLDREVGNRYFSLVLEPGTDFNLGHILPQLSVDTDSKPALLLKYDRVVVSLSIDVDFILTILSSLITSAILAS